MRDSDGIVSSILAVIILFLCVVAVWGIKSELSDKNGSNVIDSPESVRLDITDVDGSSLVGDLLDFAHANEPLYFEPGSVHRTEGFHIRNDGVAVKFLISANGDTVTDKEKFKAAFDFWIATDPDDFQSAKKLTSFSGELKENEQSEIYYLFVKMKESAGNEYQNKTFEGLGITVHAVQSLD